MITINMPKARGIHREVLRRERDEKLAAADVEYMKADEANDQQRKAAITVYKNQLRAMPADAAFEAATTPEELKAVRPSVLDDPIP